ncbi:MAG TPA: MFS transporter, partial [Thermoanaerobaculia bacterium]|nr:MFS transporter [Thermoanaerobaculia bacterium]
MPHRLRDALHTRLRDHGSHSRWVLIAALVGMFSTTFPTTILAVSLATIAADFKVAETTMAWLISAPLLFSAMALPLLGKLGDLHGHRRVFLAGFVAATLTTAATAAAWSAWSLIGLRTLSSIVGAATQPSSLALIFLVVPKHARARAVGWWSMTAAGAPALGLAVGGPLVEAFGWRVLFATQAGLSLLAVVFAWLVLTETPTRRVRFDFAGAATLTLGVTGLMIALSRLRDEPLASPWIWGCALGGALALAAFVAVERRVAARALDPSSNASPLLPLELFRLRNFSAPIAANALQGAGYMGSFVMAPLVFLGPFAFTVTATAGLMLLRTISLSLGSPLGGRLGERVGERAAAVTGSAIMTLAFLLLAWGVVLPSVAVAGAGLVLLGLGQGLARPSLLASIASAGPEEHLGIASATARLTAQVGGSFGITVMTLVYGGAVIAATTTVPAAAVAEAAAHPATRG